MSKSLVKFQNELFKDLLRKCKRNIPKTHKICLTMLIISSSWQNSKFFFTTQIATHVIAPQGIRHSLSKFTSPFLRFLPLIIPQPPYFATFYIHLLASNEPKNSQVFLTSNMVGEILRFDHCRCLEKQLLKLLGVKPPFLIDPLPFRNLPPFWIKFFTHPFQCIFKFLNPSLIKRGDETMHVIHAICYL